MSFNVDGLNYCAYAHRIVREAACPTCCSPKGVNCTNKDGKRLAASRSHRPRLEAHARAQDEPCVCVYPDKCFCK